MADKRDDGPEPPENHEPLRGLRKDGKPYKEGNTGEDGSFKVGKGRTPEHTRFATGDNRKRGKREKGTKNLATRWEKAFKKKRTLKGVTMESADWLIDQTIARGIAKSDRAAEIAFKNFPEKQKPHPASRLSDQEVLAAYLEERLRGVTSEVLDDYDIATGHVPEALTPNDAPEEEGDYA